MTTLFGFEMSCIAAAFLATLMLLLVLGGCIVVLHEKNIVPPVVVAIMSTLCAIYYYGHLDDVNRQWKQEMLAENPQPSVTISVKFVDEAPTK